MNAKVMKLMNEARARELTAILQYMTQHYELENTDYGKLAKTLKITAIVEMKHAEKLAERILFLGGVPTTKPDAEVKKGEEIAKMIKTNIALEEQAIDMYNASSATCAAEQDQVTKQIFDQLAQDETAHLDAFQNIRDHIAELGAAYLATLTGGQAD
jgi:bacterioferritin